MKDNACTIRLSSRLSGFSRVGLPLIWFSGCAVFTLGALYDGHIMGLAGLVPAAFGLLAFNLTVWRYVDLWAEAEFLRVKHRGREYNIPYTLVVDAKMHWYFRFAEISFSPPSELGPAVIYMPCFFNGIPYISNYPGNEVVLQRAKIARLQGKNSEA